MGLLFCRCLVLPPARLESTEVSAVPAAVVDPNTNFEDLPVTVRKSCFCMFCCDFGTLYDCSQGSAAAGQFD